MNKKAALVCNVCDSSEIVFYCKAKDYRYGNKGDFCYYKCQKCGLIFLHPISSFSVEDFYDGKTYHQNRHVADLKYSTLAKTKMYLLKSAHAAFYEKRGNSKRLIQKAFLHPFKGYIIPYEKQNNKILDVGCDTGAYLSFLKNLGWDTYGCELNSANASIARSRGHKVFSGVLQEARYSPCFFDVVRLEQVFEHIGNPRETLEEINRILKQNGLLIMGVPSGQALTFKIFKRFWRYLLPPHHFYLYTLKSISMLLRQYGFQTYKVKTKSSFMTILGSIEQIFEEKNIVIRLDNKKLFQFLCFPVTLSLRGRYADLFQVYARKR